MEKTSFSNIAYFVLFSVHLVSRSIFEGSKRRGQHAGDPSGRLFQPGSENGFLHRGRIKAEPIQSTGLPDPT